MNVPLDVRHIVATFTVYTDPDRIAWIRLTDFSELSQFRPEKYQWFEPITDNIDWNKLTSNPNQMIEIEPYSVKANKIILKKAIELDSVVNL